jgi:hypothetical protein
MIDLCKDVQAGRTDRGRQPKVASAIAFGRGREVGSPPELVGPLLADAEEFGDLDQAEKFARCHILERSSTTGRS